VVERVAVLLDGEFVKKTLGQRLGQFPDLGDITVEWSAFSRRLVSPITLLNGYSITPLIRSAAALGIRCRARSSISGKAVSEPVNNCETLD